MENYETPRYSNKFESVTKETYQGMACRIIDGGDMSEGINVRKGARHFYSVSCAKRYTENENKIIANLQFGDWYHLNTR